MPVRRPRKPSKPSVRRVPAPKAGNRRARATIPDDVVKSSRATEGAGSRFMETATRQPDIGHGLPKAVRPVVAVTPAEIQSRAAQKREANRRRTTANNVRGYAQPGWNVARTEMMPLPSAEDLLDMDEAPRPPIGGMPTAQELLALTTEQEYTSAAHDEGTYHFPQVAPTKTINPPRPRTLEAGWERINDINHPAYPGILRVRFRDGTPWEYYGVPSSVWQRFKRVASPGRFINRVLNNYEYGHGDF